MARVAVARVAVARVAVVRVAVARVAVVRVAVARVAQQTSATLLLRRNDDRSLFTLLYIIYTHTYAPSVLIPTCKLIGNQYTGSAK